MGKEIDDRIVSMHFDNAEFEKNVKTSMGTIDKLAASLDNLESQGSGEIFTSISKAAGNIDLSGAINAANAVKRGFDAMEVAGIAVVMRLTNAFMNFGQKLWNISFGQMKSGGMTRALNIEQAEFMLKGMKMDVAQIKEDAMYAVEDTAYGFDEAAKAAAAFGTAGVKAGDDMKKSLLGVSGVAAMTNRSYAEIADIYTKIAATGKLTSIYVDSFNVRGLNVLDALSKKLGKTQAQVKEMVSKGQIDFKTFAFAMEEAFGEHAKEADKTFSGSMGNVKAALSRIGADFATPIITDVVPVFNNLKKTINEVRKALQPTVKDFEIFAKIVQVVSVNVLTGLRESGAVYNVIDGLRYGLIAISKILITISSAINEVFPNAKGLSGVFRDIMLALIPSNEALAGLKEILKGVLIIFRVATIVIGKFVEIVLSLGLLTGKLVGNLLKMATGFKSVLDPMIEFVNTTNILDKFIMSIASGIYTVGMFLMNFKQNMDNLSRSETILNFIDMFKEKILALTEGLRQATANINWTSVATITFILGMVFVIEFLRQKLFLVWSGVVDTFGLLWNAAKTFGDMFSNVIGVLKTVRTTLDRMKFGIMADVMLKFAVSVGVLSLSLGYLASIPSDDLMKAGIAMAFVGGALFALMAYLNKALMSTEKVQLTAGAKILAISAMFVSLAIAFGTMAAVVKVFSKLSVEELIKGVLTLYSLAGLLVVISHLAGEAKLTGIVSLSIATLLLSKSISNLKDMDISTITAATLAMMGMVTVASLALLLATLIPVSLKFLDFIAFGAMMIGLSYAVKVLASIEKEDLDKAVGALTSMIDVVKKLVLASALSFMMKPAGFLHLGAMLLGMSASLYILKQLKQEEIDRGLIAIKGMANVVLYTQFVSGLCFTMKPVGFAVFAGVIAALSGIMGYLSKLDPAGIKNALLAMISLSLLINVMALMATKIEGLKDLSTKPFTDLTIVLLLLSAATKSLSKIENPSSLASAVGAIAALGLIVVLLTKLADKLKIGDFDGKIFIQLGAAAVLLSFAVNLLSSALKDNGDIVDMYLAVIAVGMLVGELMFVMSRVKDNENAQATKGLVMLAAGVLILSGAVAILTFLPITKALAATGMIALLALALAGANNMLTASYENANGFAIMAAAVGALSLIIAYLSQFDTLSVVGAAVAISAMAFALATASTLLKGGGIDTKTAGAFLMMAIGVSAMALSLSVLSQVPWNQLLVAAGTLVVFTAAMVGLGFVAGNFAPIAAGMMLISASMLAFGATALMIALSIKIVADSFSEFADTMIRWGSVSTETIDLAILNMNRFILGLESVARNIAYTAPTWGNALSIVGMQIAAVVGSITVSVAAYGGLGVLLFCKSILTQLPEILEVLATAIEAMGAFFEENKDRVYDFGVQIGKVLFDGILGGLTGIGAAIWDKLYGDEMKQEAAKQAAEVTDAVNQTMVKNMDMFTSGEITAEQMVAGLKAGLENGLYSVEDVNRELAARGLEAYRDELGIHSPAKEYIESAEFSWKGLLEGVKNGEYDWQECMAAFGEMGVDAFKEKFNAENLLGGTLGIMNNSVGKNYLGIANSWAGGKYAWERAGYSSAQQYANALEAADKEKEWDEMLGGVLDHFGLSMDDILPKMDDYEIKTDDITGNLGDMSDATGKAANETDKLTDSVSDALDVFTAFNDTATLTAREVLRTFMGQIKGVNTWSQELQALSEKGLNANFLQELADAGPDAYEKIHALYKMTDHELTLFNQMYAQKLVLERGTAQTIRNSFVKNGAMTVEAAEKLGEDISEATVKKVGESGDKLSESEQKAIKEANEDLERRKIDDAFIEQWSKGITSNENKITLQNAFTELGYSSMEALEKSTSFEIIMDKLILFKNTVKEQVKSSLNLFDEVKQLNEKERKEQQISTTQMLYNMTENVKKIGRWATNLKILASKGMSEGLLESLRALGPEGADKVDAFVRMTAEELKKANALYASSVELPEYVSDKMVSTYAKAGFGASLGLKKALDDGKDDLMFAFQDTGYEASQGFVKGVDPDAANEVMTQLGNNSLSSLKTALDSHSPSKKAEEIGVWFVEGFTLKEKMDWALQTIASTMEEFADAALSKLRDNLTGSKTMLIAKNFMEGFDVGIKKYSDIVKSSIGFAGSSIVKAFSAALGVASPSVIAEDIMRYFLEGAMIPLTNDDSVANAAKSQAETIASMFKEGMFEEGFEGDVYEPTIRPVWDNTNVSNGLAGLNGLLGGFDISGTVNRAYASTRSGPSQDAIMITNAIRDLSADNRAVRQEIANLRSDTANLGNRIDGMSVRLDSGALVGGIVNQMDSALGSKAVRVKRRKG